jgi:hypothetical protein
MKTTALLAIVAIIAAIGAVTSAGFTMMATTAHAIPVHLDFDDLGHGQSFHDSNGDFHSHGKA